MSISHLFENKIVFSNERRNINPTSLLNFNISTVSDNTYYNLYDSYIILDIEGEANARNEMASTSTMCQIDTRHQPAGLITNSKANYTYIDTSGQLVTMELNASNEYLGASRAVIDQLFSPKRIHDQDAGYLEFPYNTTGSAIFDNKLLVTFEAGTSTTFKTKLRIPFRDVIEAANTQSFVNIKSLECSLKLLDKKDFFLTDASGKYSVHKDCASAASAATIKDMYITKCELRLSAWQGDGDSAIQPSLRELSNVTIATKNILLNANATNYDDNIIVNFAPKYMIVYFTDENHNHVTLENVQPSFFRVGVSGGAQTTKCNFDNSLGKDTAYYDMVNYSCNTLREESLITYNSWNDRMHYYVYPLSELFSFKASNIIELNLQFPALSKKTIMNVIYIKDSTA